MGDAARHCARTEDRPVARFYSGGEGLADIGVRAVRLDGATVADFATGHSLVAALRQAGLQRLFVTDWRSATSEMRFLGVDDYLAELNVVVDEIGGMADLVGLCQGGWMALVYAARFPAKVRKLVLAGAPIDIAAASSALSRLAEATPLAVFHELVRLGDGLVPGRRVQKFWGVESASTQHVRQVLQIDDSCRAAALTRLEGSFWEWFSWTVDLPGVYFTEIVEKVFKRNEIATGSFVALGERIDLGTVKAPMFMLAARDDEAGGSRAVVCGGASCRHLTAQPVQDDRPMPPFGAVHGTDGARANMAQGRPLDPQAKFGRSCGRVAGSDCVRLQGLICVNPEKLSPAT